MGAMKRLLEDIKEEMGDAYDLMLAEEYQASLIATNTSNNETPPDIQEIANDQESRLLIKRSED